MLKRLAIVSLPVIYLLASASAVSALALKDESSQPVTESSSSEIAPRIPLDALTTGNGATASNEGGDVVPEIQRDNSKLPEPVQRMRKLIIDAARSGDIERLRPLLGTTNRSTQLSFGDTPDDPIDFLRSLSGDGKGYEILAILLEVMESAYVEVSPDTSEAIYVWPYFYAMPLQDLKPEQLVELMTLVTAGDYASMEEFGAYNFFRSGITPEGEWVFFVAGD